jgi:hypothetical protein
VQDSSQIWTTVLAELAERTLLTANICDAEQGWERKYFQNIRFFFIRKMTPPFSDTFVSETERPGEKMTGKIENTLPNRRRK